MFLHASLQEEAKQRSQLTPTPSPAHVFTHLQLLLSSDGKRVAKQSSQLVFSSHSALSRSTFENSSHNSAFSVLLKEEEERQEGHE
jgi:hypothetical protein